MKPYRYFLPTQSLWASFDTGIVLAHNEEEALVKAKERLTYDFEKANDVLNSADITTGFNLEFDANQITVSLLNEGEQNVMKLYQLINGSGNPASVQENDLAIFSSPKHAQEALDYFAEFGDVGDVTIKEISKFEDIVRN